MRVFSGAILEPEQDVTLPIVARIESETLILFSSEGAVGEWPLDRVKMIEVGNGHFEVVADTRKLSLVVEEPEAFEQALRAERVLRAGISYVWTDPQQEPQGGNRLRTIVDELDRGSRLFIKRPRHGRASVRLLPSLVILAAVLVLGYVMGAVVGDFIDVAATESPDVPSTVRTEVVVRTLRGSGDLKSTPFAVKAPWKVEWSAEGDNEAGFKMVVVTEDGERSVLGEGPGSGATTLNEGGVFELEIVSTEADEWSVRVVEITNPDSR